MTHCELFVSVKQLALLQNERQELLATRRADDKIPDLFDAVLGDLARGGEDRGRKVCDGQEGAVNSLLDAGDVDLLAQPPGWKPLGWVDDVVLDVDRCELSELLVNRLNNLRCAARIVGRAAFRVFMKRGVDMSTCAWV